MSIERLTGAEIHKLARTVLDYLSRQGNLPLVVDPVSNKIKSAGGGSSPQSPGGTDMIVNFTIPNYTTLIDEVNSTLTYVGRATPGASTSNSIWQIFSIDTSSGDTEIKYAGGSDAFTKVWTARATYSYS